MNRTIVFIGIAVLMLLGGIYGLKSYQKQPISSANTPEELAKATLAPQGTPTSPQQEKYVEYSPNAFTQAANSKRVLFFWASWCPTCKAAHQEFSTMPDTIPDDVVLFQTNYDSETELKKKHGITYQHTFVLVDSEGNEIAKWNGGGIAELTNKIR